MKKKAATSPLKTIVEPLEARLLFSVDLWPGEPPADGLELSRDLENLDPAINQVLSLPAVASAVANEQTNIQTTESNTNQSAQVIQNTGNTPDTRSDTAETIPNEESTSDLATVDDPVYAGPPERIPVIIGHPVHFVFIDPSFNNPDSTLNQLLKSSDPAIDWRVVHLESSRNGIDRITDVISEVSGVEAIHLLTHSTNGSIPLGNTALSPDSASEYGPDFWAWGQSLVTDGSLTIYDADVDTAAYTDLLDFIASSSLHDVTLQEQFSTVINDFGDADDSENIRSPRSTDTASTREIIFVDTNTDQYQTLIENIIADDNTDRQFDVVLLDPDQDGIKQISQHLDGTLAFDAVHLVSHGSNGQVHLGTATLNLESLIDYQQDLLGWQGSIVSGGDLLFYGCNLAADVAGVQLLNAIGNQVDYDIAASSNLTGHTELGGDWALEYTVGDVQTDVAFSNWAQSAWQHTLATITVTTTIDENDGDTSSISALQSDNGGTGISLREALIAAENTAGDDTILLDSQTYTLSIGGAANPDPATGDLDISTNIIIRGTTADLTIIDAAGLADRNFEVLPGGFLTLEHLTVANGGDANSQAGGVNNEGTLAAYDVIFDGNSTANGIGGAVYSTSSLDFQNVAVINNTAYTDGGIFVAAGTATLNNVTVSGNTASVNGAGISVTGGNVAISYSTIANNHTTTGDSGGGLDADAGTVIISNSIFADNTQLSGSSDIHGAVTSNGYNIVKENSGFTGAVGTDILGSDPALAALTAVDNTYVHPITTSSIAHDAGNPLGAPATDQRNINRDTSPDIGAFELGPVNDAPDGAEFGRYLSQLTPLAETNIHTGAAFNENYAGGTISLDSVDYDYGILTHAPITGVGTIDYPINGANRFIATLGIEDNAGAVGDAAFRVLVDGNEIYTSGQVSYDDTPIEISLDVSGGSVLQLEISNSDSNANSDHAVWAGARLEGGTVASVNVDENKANGTFVAYVTGNDADSPDVFTYSLLDDAGGRFAIDSSGQLTVANGSLLDFETNSSHSIDILITDTEGASASQTMTIQVNDLIELVQTIPTSPTVNEDQILTFNGTNSITVSDTLTGDNLLQVALSVTDGVLTLNGLTGITVVEGGQTTSTITINGTESNINAALDGMTFTPAADFTGTVAVNMTTALAADLQGHYTFDSNDATDASTGTPQHGVLTGGAVVVTDGTLGSVLSLDGIDDSVLINSTFGNPDSVSIGGWLNFNASTRQDLISIDNRVHIAYDINTDNIKGSIQVTDTTWVDLNTGVSLSGTGWHHVMYTFNDTADRHNFYIDGQLAQSESVTDSIYWSGATTSYIGQHPSAGNFLNGYVDDARIYTRALTAAEVAGIANNQSQVAGGSSIQVMPVNDAPQLDTTSDLNLPTITEDEINNGGVTVAQMLASDSTTPITDIDNTSTDGIAITTRNNGRGLWEYSIDGGSSWSVVGTVSETSALLLRATDHIRFAPNGENGNPVDRTFEFRAWDQTTGAAGLKVDSTVNGGNSAFSTNIESVSITTTDINDAPVLDNSANLSLATQQEGYGIPAGPVGTGITDLVQNLVNVTDLDASSQTGIAVIDSDTTHGHWWFSIDNGVTWAALGSVSDSSARVLNADSNTRIVFQPDSNFNGNITSAINFRAWDRSEGLNGSLQDTSVSGGLSAYSAAVETAELTITPVNDAPQLSGPSIVSNGDFSTGDLSAWTASGNVDSDTVKARFGQTGGPNGSLLQSVTTVPGQTYTLSFDYHDASISKSQSLDVIVAGGNTVLHASLDSGVTQNTSATYQFTFIADSATSTITFNDTSADHSGVRGYLDNISVTTKADPRPDLPYTENDGAVVIDSTITIEDIDNTHIATAVVQISTGYNGSEDLLSFVDQNGISGSYNALNATLTLTGPATKADFEAALRSISYTNSSENPDTTARTISFAINDGNNNSNTQTRDISINRVNDDPVNTGALPGDIAIAEDVLSPVDLSSISLSDVDSGSNVLTLRLTTATGGELTATAVAGITVAGNGSNQLMLTGSQTALNAYLNTAGVVEYLHSIEHINGDNADSITVEVTDNGNMGSGGGGLVSLGSANIDLTAVNDAPFISTNSGAIVNEGGTVTLTNAMLNATDVDDTGTGLDYTITTAPANGQLEQSASPGIAVTNFTQDDIDNNRIVFVHNGAQASSDYFDFTLNDGGENSAVSDNGVFNFTVTNINDAPVLSNIEVPVLTYTENDAPVAITSTLLLGDIDSVTMNSAIVQFTSGYDSNEDILFFNDQNGISGSYNTITGSWILSGSATPAEYESALRSITYENNSESPDTTPRTVSYTVNDGAANSNTQTRQITFISINDDPNNAGTLPSDISVTEDISSAVDLSLINIQDVDANGGTLSLQLNSTSGGNLSAAAVAGIAITGNDSNQVTLSGSQSELNNYISTAGVIEYLHPTEHTAGNMADQITVFISDNGNGGQGGGAMLQLGTVNVGITAQNDAPTININNGATVAEGASITITNSMLNSTDVDDSANGITYNITTNTLNGHLERLSNPGVEITGFTQQDINNNTVLFVHDGTQSTGDLFEFTVSDGGEDGAGIEQGIFNFMVSNTNDAPVISDIETAPLFYTENNGVAAVTSTITLSDIDNSTIYSATVQFTSGYNSEQDTLIFNDQNGISGVYNPVSGTMILSGSASLAQYETAVRSISYSNTSDHPDTVTRTVSYTINDGSENSNTQIRDITVSRVNDLPFNSGGLPAIQQLLEDTTGSVDLQVINLQDIDAVNDNITLTISSNNGAMLTADFAGSLIVAGDGSSVLALSGRLIDLNHWLNTTDALLYSPPANTNGTVADALQLTVNDNGHNGSGVATNVNLGNIAINIASVNDEPSGTSKLFELNEDQSFVFSGSDFGFTDDSDNNQLSAVIFNSIPANGEFSLNGHPISSGDSVSIAGINSGALVFTPDTNEHGTGYAIINFQVQDNGGTANGGINLDQTINSLIFNVISVNDPPQSSNLTLTIPEDSEYTFQLDDLGFTDTADNNELLFITLTDIPESNQLVFNGLPVTENQQVSSTDLQAGLLTFQPDADSYGMLHSSLTFRVTDNGGLPGNDTALASNQIGINVEPRNDAPDGTDFSITTPEDTAYQFSADDFSFTDTADPGDQLASIVITGIPVNGSLLYNGITPINPGDVLSRSDLVSGALTYLPFPDDNGIDYSRFSFQIQDDSTLPGANTDPTPNEVTINIVPVSDSPVGVDAFIQTLEDTTYTLRISDFNFSDIDNDTLAGVFINNLPTEGTLTLGTDVITAGQLISSEEINADLLAYTPDTNYNNDDLLRFSVIDTGIDSDNTNTVSNVSVASNLINFDIIAVNDPPMGSNAVVISLEDTPYQFNRSDFGFSDASDPQAGHEFLSITISSLPDIGLLTLNGMAVHPGQQISTMDVDAGLLLYNPPANLTGSGFIGFQFQVRDNGGIANAGRDTDQSPNYIGIDFPAVNDSPLLLIEPATVAEGDDLTINEELLFGTDVDDTNPEDLTITINGLPEHGELRLSGVPVSAGDTFTLQAIAENRLSYHHNGSETSSDTLTVTLTDGGEDGAIGASGNFLIEITEVIDSAPVIEDDQLYLKFGQRFDSGNGDLLASGFSGLLGGTSKLTDGYTISLEVDPDHGVVVLNPDGTFTYTHNGSEFYQDVFLFRVTNEDGISTLASVQISIEPPIAGALGGFSSIDATVIPTPTAPATNTEETSTVASIETKINPLTQRTGSARNQVGENEDTQIRLQLNEQVPYKFEERDLKVKRHNSVRLDYLDEQLLSQISGQAASLIAEVKVHSAKDAARNSLFLDGLNQLEQDFNEDDSESRRRLQVAEDLILGVSVSFTAGTLAWLFRSGALVSTLITSLPLWANLDPTRLDSTRYKKAEKENSHNDESEQGEVESMFENQK